MMASYPGRRTTKRGRAHARRSPESDHEAGLHEDHYDVDCTKCIAHCFGQRGDA